MRARAVQALGLLWAWGSLGRVLKVAGLPYAPPGFSGLAPLTSPAVAALFSAIFIVSLVAFVGDRRRDAAAMVMAVLLAAGAGLQTWQWPPGEGVNGAVNLPGAVLVAMAVARWRAAEGDREAAGIEAGAGVVAAGYVLAGLAKLGGSGFAWTSRENLGMQIVSQGYAGMGALEPLRLYVADSGGLCRLLGVGTLAIELGAVLFMLPRLRPFVAAAIVALHLGIALLMDLHHYDWMFTTVGVAMGSRSWRR